jgi:small subunit ribosomal protein S16
MLKIRLQRIGKKNSPSYRIVLVEHTSSSKSGRYIELLGSYDSKLKQRNFKKDKIQYWLSKGVQLSPTIHNLLVDEKIIDKAKVKAWRAKRREAKSAEAPTNVGAKAESSEPESSFVPTDVGATEDKKINLEEKPTSTPAEGEVGVPSSPDVTSEDVGVDTETKKE